MATTGETCLIKALLDDVRHNKSVCINNEKDREEIIRFLLEDGEEWWADPYVKDGYLNDSFHYSTESAKKYNIKDYMKEFMDVIEENKDRDS